MLQRSERLNIKWIGALKRISMFSALYSPNRRDTFVFSVVPSSSEKRQLVGIKTVNRATEWKSPLKENTEQSNMFRFQFHRRLVGIIIPRWGKKNYCFERQRRSNVFMNQRTSVTSSSISLFTDVLTSVSRYLSGSLSELWMIRVSCQDRLSEAAVEEPVEVKLLETGGDVGIGLLYKPKEVESQMKHLSWLTGHSACWRQSAAPGFSIRRWKW